MVCYGAFEICAFVPTLVPFSNFHPPTPLQSRPSSILTSHTFHLCPPFPPSHPANNPTNAPTTNNRTTSSPSQNLLKKFASTAATASPRSRPSATSGPSRSVDRRALRLEASGTRNASSSVRSSMMALAAVVVEEGGEEARRLRGRGGIVEGCGCVGKRRREEAWWWVRGRCWRWIDVKRGRGRAMERGRLAWMSVRY